MTPDRRRKKPRDENGRGHAPPADPNDLPGNERLPQSIEAERSVLGSLLRDNAVIGDVVQILHTPALFYLDAHQKIFAAIICLYNDGKPVDTVLLAEELRQRGEIDDIGGYGYLGELWNAAPTAANAEYYARTVRDRGMVRNLIHAGTEILRDAYDNTSPADELLESAERRILEVAESGLTGQTFTLGEALAEAYDRIDARTQGDNLTISGLPTGFADLDELTAGLQNSEMVIIAARPSVGKCLPADAEILLADGRLARIEDLFHARSARLVTLGDGWRFAPADASAFVDDGVKPVYRVRTRLGREVETTASHPFRAWGGWKPLAELRVGEAIAVPRRLEVFGDQPARECEVKLLAYLVGDGGLTDTCPEFTNGNDRIREDFVASVAEFGGLKVRTTDSGGTRTPTVLVASDPETVARHRQAFGARLRERLALRGTARRVAAVLGVSPASLTVWSKGACAPDEATFARLCQALAVEPADLAPEGIAAAGKNVPNPLTRWLTDLGLWGKKSAEKFVPGFVFCLPEPQVALFLNRLFATDGWATVTRKGAGRLGYATTSERLARQVQHLLLRFGVVARLRSRAIKYRDTRRPAWQLDVIDPASVRAFADRVGVFGKEAAVEKARAAAKGGRAIRDRIPAEVWDDLTAAKGSLSWAEVAERIGLPRGTNLKVGRRLSRGRLKKLAAVLGRPDLVHLADGDIYWDEVVSIEPVGMKQVYDLTVPGTHNFVANDVCVHNTAFALNLVRNIVVEGGSPVFFVSLEQSRIELAERLLCAQARVDSHSLRKGTLPHESMQRLIQAGGQLRDAKLFIDDSPGQGMLRIAANSRRLRKRQNLRLVVIDYLQLIEPENRRDPRQEQVAQISRRLKALARELSIPVIALAQVNRASEDRQDHRPRVSDLRESGSIEQDADTIFLLHRPERYEPGQHEGIVEVIIGKQRNGPVGEITLSYVKQYMRYENYRVGNPFEG